MKSIFAKLTALQITGAVLGMAILYVVMDRQLSRQMTENYVTHGQVVAEALAKAIEPELVNRDLTSVQSALDTVLSSPSVEWAYVSAPDGEVLAHTFVPQFPDSLSEAKIPNARGWSAVVMARTSRSVTVFTDPILTGIVGAVHVGFDRQKLATSIQRMEWLVLGSILGIMLAVTVAFALLARRIVAPIRTLTRAAVLLGGDQRSAFQALPVRSNDEVGVLTGAFNSMAIEIRGHHELLEERVQQRTGELQKAQVAAEGANQAKGVLLGEIKRLNDQLKQENTRMSGELEVTQRLQQMMLPRAEDMRQVASLDISGFMQPADEVGGDYYDVVSSDGGVFFGIGDVTGHGLESGVIAIMVQTAVRTLLACGQYESGKFFNVLNKVIFGNARRMNCDRNLTLSLLHYQDKLVTISGQHEEVLVVRGNGVLERHDTLYLGFPLGLVEDISSFVGEARVPLQSGDVMVVFTDGITEAMNCAGVSFGIERLSEAVRTSHEEPADAIREAVLRSLREYIGGQPLLDDISLLVIKPTELQSLS